MILYSAMFLNFKVAIPSCGRLPSASTQFVDYLRTHERGSALSRLAADFWKSLSSRRADSVGIRKDQPSAKEAGDQEAQLQLLDRVQQQVVLPHFSLVSCKFGQSILSDLNLCSSRLLHRLERCIHAQGLRASTLLLPSLIALSAG